MKNHENVIFLKSLIKAPLKTGAFFPSSKNLAASISSFVPIPEPGEYIIELGAGTGRLTAALLERGIPSSQLIILEMQPNLAKFLRKIFPSINVIEGDATKLLELLPEESIGNVKTIVSGIPMVNLRFNQQQKIITAIKNVIRPDGTLLQFTYRPGSPLPSNKLGLSQCYMGHVILNMPPAAIWKYMTTDQPIAFNFKDLFKFKQARL